MRALPDERRNRAKVNEAVRNARRKDRGDRKDNPGSGAQYRTYRWMSRYALHADYEAVSFRGGEQS